jgi:hypothetical protein
MRRLPQGAERSSLLPGKPHAMGRGGLASLVVLLCGPLLRSSPGGRKGGGVMVAAAAAAAVPGDPRAPWVVCDVTRAPHGATGDGQTSDTAAIRGALSACDEVVLPAGYSFLSGPLNLTSNQRLRVDGTLTASVDPSDYPLVLPMTGYGWGDDQNCFPPDEDKNKIIVGSMRYSPVVGSYNPTNVTVVGAGTIDGRGEVWWQNCTSCHCAFVCRAVSLSGGGLSGMQVTSVVPARPLQTHRATTQPTARWRAAPSSWSSSLW